MEKILVCLDGSPRAQGILHAAIALAKKTGAKLTLFQAIGIPAHLPDETFGMPPSDVGGFLGGRALAYLNASARDVPPEHLGGTRVEIGTAWRAICAVATELRVDLIMIGSHGYDAVDRLLGTTAAKVVNHTDRSVLIAR
jgi:nucleotide-binding universal stress UspA family protein